MTRSEITSFKQIPNVGKAFIRDFALLGLKEPFELIERDPYRLYIDLCAITGKRQDPCVIDVLISAVRYMEGGPAKKWWQFTRERKSYLKKNDGVLPPHL